MPQITDIDKYAKSIISLIEKFNKITDKIMEGLGNGEVNKNTFLKLQKAVDNFITFSKNVTFPLIFSFINSNENLQTRLSKDFTDVKFMILKIFEKIQEIFNNINENIHDDTEKIDLKSVKNYIKFAGVLMNNFLYITIDTIKYSKDMLSEEDYIKHYEDFKTKLSENKKMFDETFR